MLGKASLQYNLTKHFNIRATGSSRLVNMLGLSSKPIPFVLREQFGYSKKNSATLEATYDSIKYAEYPVQSIVPVSGMRWKAMGEIWPGSVKSIVDASMYYTLWNAI